jgi:ABC-type phosphate transport system permease subunit
LPARSVDQFIEVNINNLAAVPSVVFGLFVGGVHQFRPAAPAPWCGLSYR